ncbi:MAG: hypothetical protein ACRC4H_05995, partial [Plesiomonas sp.]
LLGIAFTHALPPKVSIKHFTKYKAHYILTKRKINSKPPSTNDSGKRKKAQTKPTRRDQSKKQNIQRDF